MQRIPGGVKSVVLEAKQKGEKTGDCAKGKTQYMYDEEEMAIAFGKCMSCKFHDAGDTCSWVDPETGEACPRLKQKTCAERIAHPRGSCPIGEW
jgi:hypothetical protein